MSSESGSTSGTTATTWGSGSGGSRFTAPAILPSGRGGQAKGCESGCWVSPCVDSRERLADAAHHFAVRVRERLGKLLLERRSAATGSGGCDRLQLRVTFSATHRRPGLAAAAA